VSGVGLNVARALQVLGHDVIIAALIGRDPNGRLVRDQLSRWGMSDQYVVDALDATPQSVIVYDQTGRRQIHVDLKTIQDTAYPVEVLAEVWPAIELAALCNINFSRGLIPFAQSHRVPIATDVHAISGVDDAYNLDFMSAADILFFSHENLAVEPDQAIRDICRRHGEKIIVTGLGERGALISHPEAPNPVRVSAAASRPVISTVGAGDALFSSFLHGWLHQRHPVEALRHATVFAAWKIGEAAASEGFLNAIELAAKAVASVE
jgi:ribokinase